MSIVACLEQLCAAHEALCQAGHEAARRAAALRPSASWGSNFKRERVKLTPPKEQRPLLLQNAADEHNLVEVVNQCATMERMIDALTWAASEASFAGWEVLAYHPTTSSTTKNPDLNNDIVLGGPNRERARFEVSDVAGEKDGNRKEEKDLESLGWGRDGAPAAPPVPIQGHTFLVVSETFSDRIAPSAGTTKKARKIPLRSELEYHHRASIGSTRIIEVRRLKPPQ